MEQTKILDNSRSNLAISSTKKKEVEQESNLQSSKGIEARPKVGVVRRKRMI